MAKLYYKHIETELGILLLGRTDNGLCLVDRQTVDEIKNWSWFKKYFASSDLVEDQTRFLNEAFQQIQDYLSGQRKTFDLQIDLFSTPFQQSVWQTLQTIPYGETMTYGQIARELGKQPGASMAVGQAVGANPIMIVVPCHRVLGQGHTLTGYRGGVEMKAKLLDIEGIPYK